MSMASPQRIDPSRDLRLHSANYTSDRDHADARLHSAGDVANTASVGPGIRQLNGDISNLEEQGKPPSDPELVSLNEKRSVAITQLTGNPNTRSYDTLRAANAEQQGITYNKAVDNENRTAVAFKSDDIALPVVELPWETPDVRPRVDQLMTDENLSFDAAVVIAMTERTPHGSTIWELIESYPVIDAEWRPQFAAMAAKSGSEIETWAASQTAGAVTFVAGDNDIVVSQREDGMIVVTSSLNGVQQGDPQIIDPNTTDRIVINAEDGNDTITIDDSVTANMVVVGGDGNDFIYGGGGNDILIGGDGDDLIRGGNGTDIVIGGQGDDNMEGGAGGDMLFGNEGADYISGGYGNDIAWGGQGRDTVYGGNGNDILQGEGDDDYMDGGAQDDLLIGADGNDTLSGGKDNDELVGGAGSDTQIGASGTDSYTGANAEDTIVREGAETVDPSVVDDRVVEYDANAGTSVSIADGSRDEFEMRVEADLETLRSLESGQQMLNTLDQEAAIIRDWTGGNQVVIQELDGRDQINHLRNPAGNRSTENGFALPSTNDWRIAPGEGRATGADVLISYNPSVNLDLNTSGATPPIVILFHELAHGYNMVTGTGLEGDYNGADLNNTGVPNVERQAVGLTVDHDGDPSTPEQTVDGHPIELTENGLRDELNLELRPFY